MATAGAAAWVVPEILTAKPAAGATLSGNSGGGGNTTGKPTTTPSNTGGTGAGGTGGTNANLTAATTPAAAGAGGSLAQTGLNIQRDAEIGAALIAGGWAMHHWASRAPKPAPVVHEAGSPDQPS
ncbi:MAG TPA: hypothetical protein VG346_07675 [Acidimicrobiales bacterium]|nr:hypothetical protein [Acidimicrobiales bacterium]